MRKDCERKKIKACHLLFMLLMAACLPCISSMPLSDWKLRYAHTVIEKLRSIATEGEEAQFDAYFIKFKNGKALSEDEAAQLRKWLEKDSRMSLYDGLNKKPCLYYHVMEGIQFYVIIERLHWSGVGADPCKGLLGEPLKTYYSKLNFAEQQVLELRRGPDNEEEEEDSRLFPTKAEEKEETQEAAKGRRSVRLAEKKAEKASVAEQASVEEEKASVADKKARRSARVAKVCRLFSFARKVEKSDKKKVDELRDNIEGVSKKRVKVENEELSIEEKVRKKRKKLQEQAQIENGEIEKVSQKRVKVEDGERGIEEEKVREAGVVLQGLVASDTEQPVMILYDTFVKH